MRDEFRKLLWQQFLSDTCLRASIAPRPGLLFLDSSPLWRQVCCMSHHDFACKMPAVTPVATCSTVSKFYQKTITLPIPAVSYIPSPCSAGRLVLAQNLISLIVCAGLVSTGVSAWQSIGWWGTFFPTVNRPWWNQAVWDTCGCCSDNITSNKFFGLMNAIFGYQVRYPPPPCCTPVFTLVQDWHPSGALGLPMLLYQMNDLIRD